MIKKFLAIILVSGVLLSLSSCDDASQLRDQSIIQGFGVDFKDNKFNVTMQVFDISNAEGSGQMVKGVITTTYSAQGKTVGTAVANSQRSLDKQTFFGQNKIMVINENAAKKELSNILDYYSRATGCRPDIQVAVTKESSEKIIKAKCQGSSIPAEKLETTLINGEYNGKSVNMRFFNVLNDYENPTSDIYLPVLKTFGKNESNVTFDGIAVFKDDKLKGYLNDEQTRGLLFINSKIKSGNVVIETAKYGKVTLKITFSNTKKKVNVEKNNINFNINVSFKCSVSEMEKGLKKTISADEVEKFQKLAAEVVEKEINSALNKCLKDYQCDVFEIGRLMSQTDVSYYKNNIKNWNKLLPEISNTVKVDCKVKKLDNETEKNH